MKKSVVAALALAAGAFLYIGVPSTADATPANMCRVTTLKAAGATMADTVRCRRYWRCHRHHCHWWRRCW